MGNDFSQGFLPVESSISEVEVWGLGGKTAKEVQNKYKKREELFTEQRRKVTKPYRIKAFIKPFACAKLTLA